MTTRGYDSLTRAVNPDGSNYDSHKVASETADGLVPHVAARGAEIVVAEATIANGASETAAIDCDGKIVSSIVMPAAWTEANLTILASLDGTNFAPLRDAYGTEIGLLASVMVAAVGDIVKLAPGDVGGVKAIKLRSGTAAAPVNQVGDRVFALGLTSSPIG